MQFQEWVPRSAILALSLRPHWTFALFPGQEAGCSARADVTRGPAVIVSNRASGSVRQAQWLPRHVRRRSVRHRAHFTAFGAQILEQASSLRWLKRV